MPGYTREQVVAMNADLSRFRVCPNCNTYWSTPQGFASHTRACKPLIVTSNIELPDEPMWFEAEVLAGIAHKLVEALIQSKVAADGAAETECTDDDLP